jgi:hypothetical protein
MALTYKKELIPVKQNRPYLDFYIDQVRGSLIRIRVAIGELRKTERSEKRQVLPKFNKLSTQHLQ